MSSTMSANRDQRFVAYLALLDQLKEDRITLREILEREILLGFIRTNRSSISEFPLLEMQQQTVIELMCQRLDHPAYDYIKKLTGNFVTLLGHYRKASAGNDKDLKDKTGTLLANTEALLIKSMQGIVYSVGLVTDNFEELVIRLYGKQALDDFSKLLKEHQMGTPFWKHFLERFIALPVAMAHDNILAEKLFSLSKEGRMLVVRYPMDAVLAQMNQSDTKMEKTRIQKAFEATIRDYDIRRILKLVQSSLTKSLAFIPAPLLSKTDVDSIARIVCIDQAAIDFRDAYQTKVQAGESQTDEEKKQYTFLKEQITAIGVGAAIGVSVCQQNIAAALMGLVPGQVKAFSALGRNFRLINIKRLMLGLLEEHFVLRLQEQAGDDLGKIQIILQRTKRARTDDVQGLGLSKIRLNKLFKSSPNDPTHLLFKPKNDGELAALIKILQLEAETAQQLVALWRADNERVELLLLMDLSLIQRTTTNLQARIQELLVHFQLVEQSKPTNMLDSEVQAPTAS